MASFLPVVCLNVVFVVYVNVHLNCIFAYFNVSSVVCKKESLWK